MPDGAVGLKEYGALFWRRRAIVIVSVVVLVGLSVAYSVAKTPEYMATAQLELTPQVSAAVLQANNSTVNAAQIVDVPTDIQVIESQTVRNKVLAKLPGAPRVTASEVGTTNIVNVSATSTNPALAAKAANLYASSYINIQQYEAATSLSNAANIVQTHINSLQSQIQSLQSQAANASGNALATITAQIASLQSYQTTLSTQIAQYQTAASLSGGGGTVVSPATVPTAPSSPKPVEYAVIALVVGLIIGLGLAVVRDRLDDGIRSAEDLTAIAGDAPLLGVIPRVADWRDSNDAYVVSESQPKAAPSEAYRSVRTSIQFLTLGDQLKTLQVTSPKAAEGKSTTVANLAVTLAQAGQQVIMVDCDLRRPRLHRFFSEDNRIGFTSVLLGDVPLAEAVHPARGIQGLRVLTAGPIPPNPSEVLTGHRTGDVMAQLSEMADIVLVDSPPVLPVTDAVVLAHHVDSVVLVTSVGSSTKSDVHRAISALNAVEAPLRGVILNNAMESDTYAYYRYSYTANDQQPSGLDTSGNGASNGRKPAHSPARRR